jgi:hypothetical protein
VFRCSVPGAPLVGTLFVGGCGGAPPFCHRVFSWGKIPADGELASALADAGGRMPLDEWTALVDLLS